MKAKISVFTVIIVVISGIIMISGFNMGVRNKLDGYNGNYIIKKEHDNYQPPKLPCDGKVFSIYPDIDSIKNKEFANLLIGVPKIEIKSSSWKEVYPFMGEQLRQYIAKKANNLSLKDDGLVNFNTRRDGNKADWFIVIMLPSNGKFISLLIRNCEEKLDPPPSRGNYLCTFDLEGNLLSMIYAYGEEEFGKNLSNKGNLNLMSGRIYCLNTNRPRIRKAKSWNLTFHKGNSTSMDLEVKEITLFISEQGIIQSENEKIIFPRIRVQWKDRAKITFESNSDTIRKMLGEIE